MMVRLARPSDGPRIVALDEAVSPAQRLCLRRELRRKRPTVAALYPGLRRYIAVAPDGETIVGSQLVSTAPTQLNGAVITSAYFMGLLVHPAHRGQGIGRFLVDQSLELARSEGASIAFSPIVRSNRSSWRIMQQLGFRLERTLHTKLFQPWPPRRRRLDLRWRPAGSSDFAQLAATLNARYARHHFWRPLTAEQLASEAAALGRPDANILLGGGQDSGLLAAASVAILDYPPRLRIMGRAVLRPLFDRLLGPLASVQLLRYLALPVEQPAITAELFWRLQRRHARHAWALAANVDPGDPVWPAFASLPGLTGAVGLWVHSPDPLDPGKPCALA